MVFYLKLLGSIVLGLALVTSAGNPHYEGAEDYGWIASESNENPLLGARSGRFGPWTGSPTLQGMGEGHWVRLHPTEPV